VDDDGDGGADNVDYDVAGADMHVVCAYLVMVVVRVH
jgi:hypothetical protein